MQDAGTNEYRQRTKRKPYRTRLQVCTKLRALLSKSPEAPKKGLRQLKLGCMRKEGIRNRGSGDGVGRLLKLHLSTKVTGQSN